MSWALDRMRSKSCVTPSVGRAVQTQAAAPAVSGVAKLVPLYEAYAAGGTATGIAWPGAARST